MSMSQNPNVQSPSKGVPLEDLLETDGLLQESKTYAFHFKDLHEARDYEPPRTKLSLAIDASLDRFPKAGVLGILQAFQQGKCGGLPLGLNQALEPLWDKWQRHWLKEVVTILSKEPRSHLAEQMAWIYTGEVVDLHLKGYRPGAMDFPKVAYLVLTNKNKDIERFAAHPKLYACEVCNAYIRDVRNTHNSVSRSTRRPLSDPHVVDAEAVDVSEGGKEAEPGSVMKGI
ncbi:hypothetical protein LTR08_002290 [Meristemomyces frigidus]|nr:hypothetical protein LTR08_002290 [Meristemomyces frigidus]